MWFLHLLPGMFSDLHIDIHLHFVMQNSLFEIEYHLQPYVDRVIEQQEPIPAVKTIVWISQDGVQA